MSKGLELSMDKIRFWCHSHNPLSTAGREGELVKFYHTQKVGVKMLLAMLEKGMDTTSFRVFLTYKFEVLAILKGGPGLCVKSLHPLKGGGGVRNKFYLVFPIL